MAEIGRVLDAASMGTQPFLHRQTTWIQTSSGEGWPWGASTSRVCVRAVCPTSIVG